MNAHKPRPLQILVIEDEPVISTVMKRFLQNEGCHVTIYDLIFSDIHLPDTTGFKIVQAYRKKEIALSIHTPIIGMSTEEGRQKCLAAGMDDFIHKPFSYDQIVDILKKFRRKNVSNDFNISDTWP